MSRHLRHCVSIKRSLPLTRRSRSLSVTTRRAATDAEFSDEKEKKTDVPEYLLRHRRAAEFSIIRPDVSTDEFSEIILGEEQGEGEGGNSDDDIIVETPRSCSSEASSAISREMKFSFYRSTGSHRRRFQFPFRSFVNVRTCFHGPRHKITSPLTSDVRHGRTPRFVSPGYVQSQKAAIRVTSIAPIAVIRRTGMCTRRSRRAL